mmetsp:Transcript_24739/g.69878  ORF Transcript_24739/g.69878 Transcript_24739/m.69878 type:complete len:201 (+) Transcript_24739:691-1293(+)
MTRVAVSNGASPSCSAPSFWKRTSSSLKHLHRMYWNAWRATVRKPPLADPGVVGRDSPAASPTLLAFALAARSQPETSCHLMASPAPVASSMSRMDAPGIFALGMPSRAANRSLCRDSSSVSKSSRSMAPREVLSRPRNTSLSIRACVLIEESAPPHDRLIEVGFRLRITGSNGWGGRVTNEAWANGPGPKPLKARIRNT